MLFSKRKREKRFKEAFAAEILEYHLERFLGKDKHNSLSWRVIVENEIQPQVDILCDFSKWLIKRGWSKDVVEKLFFVVVDRKDSRQFPKNK